MKDVLGDYFKEKEQEFRMYFDKHKHIIVRLDGMRFHNFARPFLSPFDPFLHYALEVSLIKVLNKELKGFWSAVYFQSDEASVVIPKIENEKTELPFGGRKEKFIACLLQWNNMFYQTLQQMYHSHLSHLDRNVFTLLFMDINTIHRKRNDGKDINFDEYIQRILFHIDKNPPSFDCRFIQVDTLHDIQKYMEWRRKDAIRNYKNMLGRCFISHKKIEGMTADAVIEKVKEEKNIDYYAFPTFFKRGNIYLNNKWENPMDYGFGDDDGNTITYKKYVLEQSNQPKSSRRFYDHRYYIDKTQEYCIEPDPMHNLDNEDVQVLKDIMKNFPCKSRKKQYTFIPRKDGKGYEIKEKKGDKFVHFNI